MSEGIQKLLLQGTPTAGTYQRIPAAGGSRRGVDAAIRQTDAEIDSIQLDTERRVRTLSAPLTTEKNYLMGKFAHFVCAPRNRHNGRMCMVSAGAGKQKAFGHDRAANPGCILGADVVGQRRQLATARPSPRTVWRPASGGQVGRGSAHQTDCADLVHVLTVKPGAIRRFSTAYCTEIEHDWLDYVHETTRSGSMPSRQM